MQTLQSLHIYASAVSTAAYEEASCKTMTFQTVIAETLPVVLQTEASRSPWLFAGQQGRAGPVMYLLGPQTAMSRARQAMTAVQCTRHIRAAV